MRKFIFVILMIAAGYAAAQDRDFSKVEMKVSKVAGNVYMLAGAGGNIGALVGDDGIIIIDDQYAPLVDKIRSALKGITDKPVRFIINTHYHPDHTGGNALFSETSTIIAQENVRKRLQTGGTGGNGGSVSMEMKPAVPEAWPIITFEHDVTVHINGEDIRALHFPSGHTDGDSIIFFPKANVVHMGDDFVTYGFPFIDVDAGGSVKGMIEAVESVIQQIPADAKIIPGHGPVSTVEDMRQFVKMLKDTSVVIEKAIAGGKTVEQMKKEKILDAWQKYGGDFITTDAYIETVYNSLTGKTGAGLIKHN